MYKSGVIAKLSLQKVKNALLCLWYVKGYNANVRYQISKWEQISVERKYAR